MSLNAADKLKRAVLLTQQGRHSEAELLCRELLTGDPSRHAEVLHVLGLIALQKGEPQQGIELIQRSLSANPRQPSAHLNLGVALLRQERARDAIVSMERGLRFSPGNSELLCGHGRALLHAGRPEQALASFGRVLQIKNDHAGALEGRADALGALRRNEDALAAFNLVLHRSPGNARAFNARGIVLQRLNKPQEALADFDRALGLSPDYPQALCNRGVVLHSLGKDSEALLAYDRALQVRPDFAEALVNRADTLRALDRDEEAAASYSTLLRSHPDYDYARGGMLHIRLAACLWDGYERECKTVVKSVRDGRRACWPFPLLSITDSAEVQLRCARTFIAAEFPPAEQPLCKDGRYGHERLRLAYVSADFHEHATAHLIAELLELHDRQQFELTLVSLGSDDGGPMRQRLIRAADRFIEARTMSDQSVAQLMRDSEIDIAVDLKGFTQQARTGIFAMRPAPVQVNYLGYPGTMGAPYIDYIIADSRVIPPSSQGHYTEKVAYLPECYQVNDSKCLPPERVPGRSEVGLPETGFVFCSFNALYKITPPLFDIWMRLLREVPGSVLWLLQDSVGSAEKLRSEATQRGIDRARLVFAPWSPLPDHLARQGLADLFLDTLPVNAHTTASDALRMGLPLLTCVGNAFAARVAGSLLHTVGLPELVTETLTDYEHRALALATNPAWLSELRTRLQHNLITTPLFNTNRFRRHLEEAYRTMVDRHQRGLLPAGFSVSPQEESLP